MKKIFVSFISQILPVMLGVYLGFAINNFGEDRKLRAQSDTYRMMLKQEISANLEGIKNVSDYHIEMSSNFYQLLESEDIVESFKAFEFTGFRTGFVSSSAYETGIQTGIIQEFDMKLIQRINKLYTLQGKYNRFSESMISSFLAGNFPETESEVKNLLITSSMSMNDIVIFERELIESYEMLLKRL